MKRFAFIVLLAAACQSTPGGTGGTGAGVGQTPGAPSARAAVEAFLASVRAQDLQAMSIIWGTSRGPARDVLPDREQLEKRELIMQCYLAHDRFRILSDTRTGEESHTVVVSLTKGDLTRQTNFYTVRGPSDRWYVERADLEPVEDLCKDPPTE
ncbi:MAG TPA: hypothetical protein VJ803_06465 [Gemmatimonadaceae bacterium]|nr:hypothetical protein [Gemmatimonadaceae bacterium]